jgi:hypothetical protein
LGDPKCDGTSRERILFAVELSAGAGLGKDVSYPSSAGVVVVVVVSGVEVDAGISVPRRDEGLCFFGMDARLRRTESSFSVEVRDSHADKACGRLA